MTPEEYMQIAIEEAKKGSGFTSPNPLVGAVLVKDGKIVGKDYHHKYGEFHAERNAILNCKEDLAGASLYVTLEPCCHYGKTPPCTQIIIEKGIEKVYIGSYDPNPKVNGGGIKQLKDAGIEVVTEVLKEECDALNPVFFHYIEKKRTLRRFKICDDSRWKNCHKDRSFQMDYRRGGEKTCAVQPQNLQRDHGRDRNRVSR